MKKLVALKASMLAILLASSGCSSVQKETEYGPNVSERRAENLMAIIERDSGCDTGEQVYSYIDSNQIHRIKGCNKKFDYILYCAGYCHWVSIDKLKQRAEFDLDCGEELNVSKIGETTWGVKGCSKRASYIPIMNGLNVDWIQNGAGTASQVNQSNQRGSSSAAAAAAANRAGVNTAVNAATRP